MDPKFEKLSAFARECFEKFKADAGNSFPQLQISWNFEETQFYLSILNRDAGCDEPDLVEFSVALLSVDGAPLILADIVWGEGSGKTEMEFETQDRSDQSFNSISEKIPDFLKALLNAAVRGPERSDRIFDDGVSESGQIYIADQLPGQDEASSK